MEGHEILGKIDDVTEGFGNLLFYDMIIPNATLPICTPYESKTVGPVTLTVRSVCV